MKNGIWENVRIDMTRPGTAAAPVRLKAETNGAVILRGVSQLIFSADWQHVSGLCFRDGGGAFDKKYFSVVRFNANNCRLTESAIVDFRPSDPKTGYYYVFFAGNVNRMDHCLLTGKSNNDPVVGNADENSRHNRVDHCMIRFMAGEYIDKGLTASYKPKPSAGAPLGRMPWYGCVRDCFIANNTLVNNDGPDFLLGFRYKYNWPAIQMILLPERNSIVDNFIVKRSGAPVVEETPQDMTPPFDVVKFWPNMYAGNVCIGGAVTVPSAVKGFAMHPPPAHGNGSHPAPGVFGLAQQANEDILRGEDVGPSWQAK